MIIDFEIKAFCVSVIFAAIKLFGLTSHNEMHLYGLRAFFGIIHLYFVSIFIRANIEIENGLGSKESKNISRSNLRKLLGSIALRAIVIAFVHVKTSMLPPLLVSSAMAAMSVLENDHCEGVIFKKKRA